MDYLERLRDVEKIVVEQACSALRSVNQELLVGVNWAYEGGCPAPQASYHAKYFDQFGKPFNVMTTRFLGWLGDWGLKPPDQVLAERATVAANGGLCIICDLRGNR